MKTTITQFLRTALILVFVLIFAQKSMSQFTPGEGGSLPAFPNFVEAPNKISGLYVAYSQRRNNTFSSGTRAVVDLSFPEPSVFGAESYTLQYSDNNGQTWANYKYNNADVISTYNNFSLDLENNYWLRLLVNGGPKNGYTSNEVYAPLSSVDTRFSGWSLDEGMFITGIMAPFIGRGLEASYSVKKLADESDIAGYLTYQWYRVNPATYEMIPIKDATNLKYITAGEDAGYALCLRATGDGVNVGGFAQVISSWPNIFSVNAYTSNVSTTGFTLNLFNSTNGGLKLTDFALVDNTSTEVPINKLTQGENAAIYNFEATLDPSKEPYMLSKLNEFWVIASEIFPGHSMPMVFITFPSGINNLNNENISIYPVPSTDQFNFKSDLFVKSLKIYSVNGEKMFENELNKKTGSVDISNLSNGIYLVYFNTENGVKTMKLNVLK